MKKKNLVLPIERFESFLEYRMGFESQIFFNFYLNLSILYPPFGNLKTHATIICILLIQQSDSFGPNVRITILLTSLKKNN